MPGMPHENWRDVSGSDGGLTGRQSRTVVASSAQRRMYFAWALRPDGASDIWQAVLVVDGELATDRLERALKMLHRRHEAFRTTFVTRDGEVLQVVRDADDDADSVLIDVVAAEGESPAERREWADAELRRRSAAPFDLASGPLWRTTAIRLSSDRHLVMFLAHHIMMDEMSARVFAEELRLAYADPDAAVLAAPAKQYADFCLLQNGAEADREGLDYWRGRLTGVEPNLPEDGGHDPDVAVGSLLPVPLPEHVAADFETFCKERSITPFTGLLAVYFILLRRWAGADETVGAQMIDRPHSDYFRTIGFFANTVVLRSEVRPTSTFAQFLDEVGATVRDALDYQDVPFELVVDALAPERDADRNPLFQAAIEYDTFDPAEVWALDGLEVAAAPEQSELSAMQFDLTLRIRRLAGRLTIGVEYDRRRFSDAVMLRFTEAYGTLLASLTRMPEVPLGSIPVLDGAELAQTLALGAGDRAHDAAALDSECASAWELFERIAASVPEREAVVSGTEHLSFAELADRARTMAAGLRARGVRTGTMVGICLPRRSDLIVAMLATWCAGGAFMMLDPQQPVARRRLLLREGKVALVVADESFAEVATVSAAVLLAGAAGSAPGDRADGGSVRRPAKAPAYVLFTSGSTGQPKGVVIDQAGLVAHATTQLAPMYARLPEGRQVNVGALSSMTFDVFINQCLSMIAFGHRLLLIDDEERMDPLRLIARGSDPGTAIDVLDCSSSQMEILIDAGALTVPYPPAIVMIGAERASDRLWRRLHEQPGLLAFNMYGLTECTVDSAVAEIGDNPRQVAGRAVGTARIYIVDDHLQLLPPDFVGEVCVGGLGVGQGYVGQPAFTSERFIADPFHSTPGQRMYRTGDKGRLRPDGQLEILSRIDHQVKVRGLRVEPGEVEAALLGHPAVDRAAVVATDAGTRMAQLVAFVIAGGEGGDGLTTSAVREFLRGRLPTAMLPDRVVLLDTFPITANGKLDRKALLGLKPSGEESSATESSGIEPPNTGSSSTGSSSTGSSSTEASAAGPADPAVTPAESREQQLCQIVAEVLGLPEVDAEESFFALGGNSLLAMQVTSRVRTVLGCEMRLRLVFDSPSIRDLAAQLGTAGSAPRPVVRRKENA
ncbi:amino acid adenylation domain-containing protein [Catenulispora sp. GAS73]